MKNKYEEPPMKWNVGLNQFQPDLPQKKVKKKEELSEYNATGYAKKARDQAMTIFMIAFFIFCIVFIWWIIKINS